MRGLSRAGQAFVRVFFAERGRWFLWLPVLEGIGVELYFAQTTEPSWWAGIAALAGALLLWGLAARCRVGEPARQFLVLSAVMLAVIASGFVAAQWQAWRVRAPILSQTTPALRFEGIIGDIEILPVGCRIILDRPTVEDLLPDETPSRIRLKLRSCPNAIGDRIWGRALLFPVPPPQLPGGYDFQRQSYFDGIGATGFTVGWLGEQSGPDTQSPGFLLGLRHEMTARIMAALPGAEGGVAAALITGEKAGIPAPVAQDFRDAGLAHMLVIAGLHMTLVAGFVFFATRALMALIPAIALRYPIKKIAALVSLMAALAYLAISGASVPTERAFVMCALGIIAILFDRTMFSMRGLALAALAILTADPVALMGVSFQMSFAAVVGLISFYEYFARRRASPRETAGWARRVGLYLLGIAVTTVVATLGTIPFTIYHFGRVALYSVLANVVAVPLAGTWILPWAFIACVLMPFHGESIGLVPMGWGIRVVEAVAHWTASLPRDILILPAMPDTALGAISIGGLWLALWRTNWRFFGLLPIVAGFLTMPLATPPDVFLSDDAHLMAVRGNDGTLYVSSSRHERMAAENWQTAAGLTETAPLPEIGTIPASHGAWSCQPDTCVWTADGRRVVLQRQPLDDDTPTCPQGDWVLSTYAIPRQCRQGATILDPVSANLSGAQTIWLANAITLRSVNRERGARPWIPPNSAASAPPVGPGP